MSQVIQAWIIYIEGDEKRMLSDGYLPQVRMKALKGTLLFNFVVKRVALTILLQNWPLAPEMEPL